MAKTTYVWNELSDNVIEEVEDGVLTASYDHEPGLYGNLLRQTRNGVTSYFHYDGRGDTVALTDDSGDVTDTKEYDAWGNVIVSTGSTVTPHTFLGRKGYHMDTILQYYVRARLYTANLAMWNAVDPDAAANRRATLYGYVKNSPISLTDPSGLRVPPYDDARVQECKAMLWRWVASPFGNNLHGFRCAGCLTRAFLQGSDPSACEYSCEQTLGRVVGRPGPGTEIFYREVPFACGQANRIDYNGKLLRVLFRNDGLFGFSGLYWAFKRAKLRLSGFLESSCGERYQTHDEGCCCQCSLDGAVQGKIEDTIDYCSSLVPPATWASSELPVAECGCILEDWAKNHPDESHGRFQPYRIRFNIKPTTVSDRVLSCPGRVRSLINEPNDWVHVTQ